MTIVHEFEYVRPKSLREAWALMEDNPSYCCLAGGTDVVVNLKEEVMRPDVVIDLKAIHELNRLEIRDGCLQVGALVTFSQIVKSELVREKCPVLMEVAKTVGSVGIRNRATLAGNICSAVPCMDSGPVLTAYEARLVVRSARGTREVPVADWFKGPRKTDIRKGEIVTDIVIGLPAKRHGGCYVKLGRYCGEDLGQASVLVLAFEDRDVRVAFGSVAPVPVRARTIEGILRGKRVDEKLIGEAVKLVGGEISPITDIRASKEYRYHMCRIMFERGMKAALERLAGKGPEYGTNLV